MTGLHLLTLTLVVAFGAIVPVVPTGAAVSAAAVLATPRHPFELVAVVLAGAAGAYVGDVTTYAALRSLGPHFAQRIGWLQRDDPQATLAGLRSRIEAHELRTLLVSRLVPGGRIPVLLAAALGGYPLSRFVSAAVAAALLWSALYAAIGMLGDSLFPNQTVALVVVIGAALLASVGPGLVQRLRRQA